MEREASWAHGERPKVLLIKLQIFKAQLDPVVGGNVDLTPEHWDPWAFRGVQTQEGSTPPHTWAMRVRKTTPALHHPFIGRKGTLQTSKWMRYKHQTQQLPAVWLASRWKCPRATHRRMREMSTITLLPQYHLPSAQPRRKSTTWSCN